MLSSELSGIFRVRIFLAFVAIACLVGVVTVCALEVLASCTSASVGFSVSFVSNVVSSMIVSIWADGVDGWLLVTLVAVVVVVVLRLRVVIVFCVGAFGCLCCWPVRLLLVIIGCCAAGV